MSIAHIGVDGCRAGWAAVTRRDGRLAWEVFRTIEELASLYPEAKAIFIDCPIGLPWPGHPHRPCDLMARKLLGRTRQASVFPVPCRQALAAGTFEEAARINRRLLGKRISLQTWGIAPKIREVDDYLKGNRYERRRVREVHPEVCFWALAGKRSMTHPKKSEAGRRERRDVLERHDPAIGELIEEALMRTRRSRFTEDDLLDAAAAFLTAESRAGGLTALSGDPAIDEEGLPMEMLYLET